MIKHIMDYRVFLKDYIYKNYEDISIKELLEDLGIDMDYYCGLMENKEKLSKNVSRKVVKLINKFERSIEDKDFLRKLISRIVFICNTGKIVIDENYFKGEYVDKNKNYSSKITFSDDMICSYVKCGDDISNMVYKKYDSGYNVKYSKKISEENGVLLTQVLECYENKFQNYEYLEEKYIDNFDKSQDYFIKCHAWKLDDFILMKEFENHCDKEFVRNLIGKISDCDNKKLNYSGSFYSIDDDTLKLYLDKKICVSDMWAKSKGKVRSIVNS